MATLHPARGELTQAWSVVYVRYYDDEALALALSFGWEPFGAVDQCVLLRRHASRLWGDPRPAPQTGEWHSGME